MTPEVRELLRKIAEMKLAMAVLQEFGPDQPLPRRYWIEKADVAAHRTALSQLYIAIGAVQGQAAIVRLYNEYEEEACKPTSVIMN